MDTRDILLYLNSIYADRAAVFSLFNLNIELNNIMNMDRASLKKLNLFSDNIINKILNDDKEAIVYRIKEKLDKIDADFMTFLDKDFPSRLLFIDDPPYLLFYKGKIIDDDSNSVAIVGARKSTSYGQLACKEIARDLSMKKICIISGLALGIDSIAHQTALENANRTIAVIGNGIDQIYPRRNERLYSEIADHGAVISEFPLGEQPLKFNFPVRNRIISALSRLVIVVEAQKRSGSLITARLALEQGRDVYAVPGNIFSANSEGCNMLIRDGAGIYTNADDLIETSGLVDNSISMNKENLDLSEDERKVYDIIKNGDVNYEIILAKAGLDSASLSALLTILELKGVITSQGQRTYYANRRWWKMDLIIVESPTKAKTISKFLSKTYKIIASKGHLRDLPKSRFAIDVENNFEPEYINIRGKGPVINELKDLAKKADRVYLATDPDREGEAISYHLAYILGIDLKDLDRIEFHEITKNAVTKAIAEPRSIDMDLVDAQQARRVLDRIVGYKISPILWKKIRSGLSAGRVQSSALKLIVDRKREIDAFVPEEYWNLKALYKHGSEEYEAKFVGTMDGKGKVNKIDVHNVKEKNAIVKEIKASEHICESVKKSLSSRMPSPPYTTSTLQQDASRILNFSSSKTMKVAQSLYEGINIGKGSQTGLITYMRTDSTRLSDEACGAAQSYIIGKFGKEYHKKNNYAHKQSKNAQDAHEAIRPVNININPSEISKYLSQDELKLYRLIWQRFLMTQMASAKFDTLTIDFASGKYIFRANYKSLKFDGFLKVSSYEKFDEKKDVRLKANDKVDLEKIEGEKKFTQPKSYYTEATLIKALEELGIGRPSTYSPTISTLINRNYIEIEKKMFIPTELGISVTKLLEDNFKSIVDAKFTAYLESKLDDISVGKLEWKDVIASFYKDFIKDVEKAEKEAKDYELKDEVSDVKCKLCGRPMLIKRSRYGKFLGCSGFPECKYTEAIVEKTGAVCPKCGHDIIKKKSKTGRIFYGCSNYPNCDFATFDEVYSKPCPKCGKYRTIKRKSKENVITCPNCGFEEVIEKKKS